MNRDEQQRIRVALKKATDARIAQLTARNLALTTWLSSIEGCCIETLGSITEKNNVLTDWAADYAATYSNYICQQQDNEIIDWQIVFDNYKCQVELIATTTTTTAVGTTTTTIDPDLEEWQIIFSNYLCQADPDEELPLLKSEIIEFSATYEDYVCAKEDNPSATTTTTTPDPLATTTTTTYVDPEDVSFSSTYVNYICAQFDNPLIEDGITTTTTFVDEDDVDWQIVFANYKCQLIVSATTTTTTGLPPETTTTTTEVATTTTTTLAMVDCDTEITGEMAFPEIHWIDMGSGTGIATLHVNTGGAPDRFEVLIDGIKVLDTGYCGDTSFQVALYAALAARSAAPAAIIHPSVSSFPFAKTSATHLAVVKVWAPLEESSWSFTLGCVESTTTTTPYEEYEAAYENYICAKIDNGQTTTTTEPPATTTTTTDIPVYEVSCGTDVHTGGQTFPTVYIVIGMGAGTGYVTLTYDTIEIPDRFVVEMNGLDVIDTGYRGDTNLQTILNAALASYGESPSAIIAGGSGTATFYKSSSSTLAIVKVWAPIPESKWSFSLSCPDDTITTTTTEAGTTTTSTEAVTTTTTTPAATTTTTTNVPPVSSANALANSRDDCAQQVEIAPADFTFTDANGDDLTHVKIVSYTIAGGGSLKYNGITVTNNQIIQVYGGAAGSFLYPLVYTPDATAEDAYADTITFLVKTANNENYG
jgi:hypothetical protein